MLVGVVPFPWPFAVPQSIAPRNYSNINKFTINSPTNSQSYIFNHTHLLYTTKIVTVHTFFLSISRLSYLTGGLGVKGMVHKGVKSSGPRKSIILGLPSAVVQRLLNV